MINRYRRARAQISAVTLQQMTTAKNINSLSAILSANKMIGEFEFTADEKLKEALAGCSVQTWAEKSETSNKIFNRAKIMTDNGNYFARVYGVKGAVVDNKTYSAEESAKFSFGFCTSDGERVSDAKVNPNTGEVEKVPIIYVSLA